MSLPGALAAAVAPLQREDTERLESAGAHPILPAIFLELPQLAYLRLICGDQQLPQPPEGNAMLPAVGLQSVQVAVHAQLCFQAARCIINACTGKAKTELTPSGFWGGSGLLVMALPQSSGMLAVCKLTVLRLQLRSTWLH